MSITVISHFIDGLPAPAGSKRAFIIPGQNRASITDAGGEKTADWKRTIKHFVREHLRGVEPEGGALGMRLVFKMPRPKSHYRTGRFAGLLKPDAPAFHTNKPDTTKLIRGVEDAMTGVVWRDDTQIVVQESRKEWTTGTPGVQIEVWRME